MNAGLKTFHEMSPVACSCHFGVTVPISHGLHGPRRNHMARSRWPCLFGLSFCAVSRAAGRGVPCPRAESARYPDTTWGTAPYKRSVPTRIIEPFGATILVLAWDSNKPTGCCRARSPQGFAPRGGGWVLTDVPVSQPQRGTATMRRIAPNNNRSDQHAPSRRGPVGQRGVPGVTKMNCAKP